MTVRFVIACLLTLLVGCGESPPSSPSTAGPTPDGAIPPTALPVAAGTAGASATDKALPAAALSQLTQVARRYAAEQRRAPKTLDELVTSGYLSRVPEAPAGKKFAIDRNLQVYLAHE